MYFTVIHARIQYTFLYTICGSILRSIQKEHLCDRLFSMGACWRVSEYGVLLMYIGKVFFSESTPKMRQQKMKWNEMNRKWWQQQQQQRRWRQKWRAVRNLAIKWLCDVNKRNGTPKNSSIQHCMNIICWMNNLASAYILKAF